MEMVSTFLSFKEEKLVNRRTSNWLDVEKTKNHEFLRLLSIDIQWPPFFPFLFQRNKSAGNMLVKVFYEDYS